MSNKTAGISHTYTRTGRPNQADAPFGEKPNLRFFLSPAVEHFVFLANHFCLFNFPSAGNSTSESWNLRFSIPGLPIHHPRFPLFLFFVGTRKITNCYPMVATQSYSVPELWVNDLVSFLNHNFILRRISLHTQSHGNAPTCFQQLPHTIHNTDFVGYIKHHRFRVPPQGGLVNDRQHGFQDHTFLGDLVVFAANLWPTLFDIQKLIKLIRLGTYKTFYRL